MHMTHHATGCQPDQAAPTQSWRQPDRRDQFEVAIVCALPLEYDAVSLLVDNFWDDDGDHFGRAVGDRNTYTTGRIGNYDVVVALLPGMGKVNAAIATAGLRSSYINLKLVLLTGICGGAPKTKDGDEILLGDVVIGEAVVQYDLGKRYADHFAPRETNTDSFGRPNGSIRSLLATMRTQLGLERLQQRTSYFLRQAQTEATRKNRSNYSYPGTSEDTLFAPDYRHRHHGPSFCICNQWRKQSDAVCQNALSSTCMETGCDKPVVRKRLEMRRALEGHDHREGIQEPAIFLGSIASGDTVMKSGEDRDHISVATGAIAFEMEGSGIWEEVPCIVIKGVCDYADSHKNKSWQNFAAATAASATKAILERYIQTDKDSTGIQHYDSDSMLSARRHGHVTGNLGSPLSLEEHWRYALVSSALASFPKALREHLLSSPDSERLGTSWAFAISDYIKNNSEAPPGIAHTIPYERWKSGAERFIWYQVLDHTNGIAESSREEYEEIPLSFLGELEKVNGKFRSPAVNKRYETTSLYAFYVADECFQEDNALSPLQHFLWSLIIQTLLWRSRSMSHFLGWLGAIEPGSPSSPKVPEADRLRLFLRSLLELNGSPLVITLCHAERLVNHSQTFHFLSDLYTSGMTTGVPFHLVVSSSRSAAPTVVPWFSPRQILNRETERNECLTEFKFDGQFLRRDEVSTADEGTNDWIWEHPSFLSWKQRPSGVLWIEGKAGSGKSVLAKTIRFGLGRLRELGDRGLPLPPISDWFYSSRHGDTTRLHTYFLRSTLTQLLEQNNDSFPQYASIYRQKKKDQDPWRIEDYESILMELATKGVPATCIVDAMDESDEGGENFELRVRIIELMAKLSQAPLSQIRFIVLSRYTADIDRALRKFWNREDHFSHIILERENWRDVTQLVANGLAGLKNEMDADESDDEDPIHSSPRIQMPHEDELQVFHRMRSYLIDHADGVILWVKLAIRAMSLRVRGGFYNMTDLEAELRRLPRDLIDFYKLILRDLEARYSISELERTRAALMWVVGASAIRPLALDELYESLCIPPRPDLEIESSLDPITHSRFRIRAKSWLGFYRQLRVRCGPFLELIIPQTGCERIAINPRFTVQLLHRTVKDFLHNPAESGPISFSEKEAENFVQLSMRAYMTLILPVVETKYCPVPAKPGVEISATVMSMVKYLNEKNLLEFALTAIPEEEVLGHLMIFEASTFPPLMDLHREQWPWDETLSMIVSQYITHGCEMGLTTTITNLLTIASILILSWPTLLRYGSLGIALAKGIFLKQEQLASSGISLDTCDEILLEKKENIRKAIDMVVAFSHHESSLMWDCGGVLPGEAPQVRVPSSKKMGNLIGSFESSHGKKAGKKRRLEPYGMARPK